MSQQNNISVQIPADKLTRIESLLAELNTELAPYLISLTSEQKQGIYKMGDNSIAFVNKIVGYINTNPEFVPPFLNTDDFKVDVAAVGQLSEIAGVAAQLSDNITDTLTLSGSEAMVAALIYYNSVKQAAKTSIPGAKTIFDDLSARFALPSRASKTPKP